MPDGIEIKKTLEAKAIDLCYRLDEEKILHKLDGTFIEFHDVSNESDFDITINKLKQCPIVLTEKTKVAFLSGEGNTFSLLPELSVDVLIWNDIVPDVTQYTQFLFSCLQKATTIAEFKSAYYEKSDGKYLNPVTLRFDEYFNIDYFWHSLRSEPVKSCKEMHFLSSEARYRACREAAQKIKFTWTNIDVFDHTQCHKLREILNDFNAVISIMNLTNIHHYDTERKLANSVRVLVGDENEAMILYSVGRDANVTSGLKSKMTPRKEHYFQILQLTDERMSTPRLHGSKHNLSEIEAHHWLHQANNKLQALTFPKDECFVPIFEFRSSNGYFTLILINESEYQKKVVFTEEERLSFFHLLNQLNPWTYGEYYNLENFNIRKHVSHVLGIWEPYDVRNFLNSIFVTEIRPSKFEAFAPLPMTVSPVDRGIPTMPNQETIDTTVQYEAIHEVAKPSIPDPVVAGMLRYNSLFSSQNVGDLPMDSAYLDLDKCL